MRMRLRLVVAVTSATALLEVNKLPSLVRSIHGLQEFWPTLPLTVVVDEGEREKVSELLAKNKVSHELLVCEVRDARSLTRALSPISQICDVLVIHDAARPLTSSDQFQRVLEALVDSIDAVRPAIAFTETLKIIKSDAIIKATLDRTQVRRISTPELVRTSAIDIEGEDCGWFVTLKKGARTDQVEGSPEALRINSAAERDLLESFLHWRQITG